jgi:MFS family permease
VSDKERSAVLGHFNAASSIGFILGPVVAGHVAEREGGFFYVACVAGTIFLANSGNPDLFEGMWVLREGFSTWHHLAGKLR